MAKKSIVVHKLYMSNEMKRDALQVASLAVNMYRKSINIANYIVKEFDRKHGASWQCIMGNCCFNVTHEENHYIRFSVGKKEITLFKTA